jgi:hypothetical protein
MTDASFIVAGWIGSAAAIALYALQLRIRTRRHSSGGRR